MSTKCVGCTIDANYIGQKSWDWNLFCDRYQHIITRRCRLLDQVIAIECNAIHGSPVKHSIVKPCIGVENSSGCCCPFTSVIFQSVFMTWESRRVYSQASLWPQFIFFITNKMFCCFEICRISVSSKNIFVNMYSNMQYQQYIYSSIVFSFKILPYEA